MINLRAFLLLAVSTVAACDTSPVPYNGAARYAAINQMSVWRDPAVPGQFEVFTLAGAGPIDFWCAAGDYVTRGRGMATNARIYLVAPVGPSTIKSGSRSAVFTVLPKDALQQAASSIPQSDYSLSLIRVGGNWRAAHVTQNCKSLLFPFSILAD
ncbi:MAG: hypothetical protein COB39_08945 [Marinosulfonomonas sp.]|nr:MAG: hypothetical protein COB39_08945 [Marinosulfonomonas sp.]